MNDLLAILNNSRVYDLAQPYFVGMPHFPTHPPFLFGLTKKHGDYKGPGGMSSAADSISFGGHLGTHMDALNHFSCGGKLFGGLEVKDLQSYGGGVNHHSIEKVAPILRRGVLLDIAGQQKVDALPGDFEISPGHLETALKDANVTTAKGDVVLIRTGWARFYEDGARYISGNALPRNQPRFRTLAQPSRNFRRRIGYGRARTAAQSGYARPRASVGGIRNSHH